MLEVEAVEEWLEVVEGGVEVHVVYEARERMLVCLGPSFIWHSVGTGGLLIVFLWNSR